MTFAESLPAAVAEHAAARPEEPWFFVRAGWDWVWSPWREVVGEARGWAERLAGIPAGTRVGFPDRPWPRALAVDLGAQAAGLTSVPLHGEEMERMVRERGCGAWIDGKGRILLTAEVGENVREAAAAVREAGPRGSFGDTGAVRSAGAVAVMGSNGVEERSQAELRAAAEVIQASLAGEGGGREIVVVGGWLEEADGRRLMAWATFAGAAVVLEDEPAAVVPTAVWTRPTVFQGGVEEVARLRRGVEETSGWLRHLPFGRLHTLLVAGGEEVGEEDRAFWSGRGVRVARVV